MSNTAVARRPAFSMLINTESYQQAINNALQDPKRAQRFIASITSAVAINTDLQNCDAATILSGALLGESLGLSPSPQLGQFYLVPFNNSKKGCKDAQFILGYKGYIQLALRSGYYKKLNVLSIKEGELVNYDPLNEELEVNIIKDELVREQAKTIGYYAMFEYLNGFKKAMYWSREKMEAHALRYSKGDAANKGYTFWEKDFDSMAYKTMLRQLISKWGLMSIDLQTALEEDLTHEDNEFVITGAVIEDDEPVPELESETEPDRKIAEDPKQVNMNDL